MREKEIFEYAVIRLVPSVEREEFINIGVILLCRKRRFLDLKFRLDSDRIKCFAPETDLEMIQQYLEGWKEVCKGGKAGGKIGQLDLQVRFRWLTAKRSTIIQSSAVHSGLCEEPEGCLERLFGEYV
ncbi:MAG: DUF3037 domain-containing protein [Saprospiraceae bacterium]